MPKRSFIRAAGTCALLGGACLIGCLTLGPTWREVRALGFTPQQFTRDAGADQAVVVLLGLLLWIVCGWLTIAVACCAGGALPGRVGRASGRIARLISPRLVRRALGVAVGVSLGPAVAQGAAASPPAYAVVSVAELSQDGIVQLVGAGVDWPVEPAAPASPTDPPPTGPVSTPTVAVQPGDCLWSLVEAHLGYGATIAEVSGEVDRWWDANAEVIGADPDLLVPGQILVVPRS